MLSDLNGLGEVLAGYSMQTVVRFSKCKQGYGTKNATQTDRKSSPFLGGFQFRFM